MSNLRFANMEQVLQAVNKDYIAYSEEEERKNKRILESALKIIERMKEVDPLFEAMYRDKFYGGSVYDGLRVGKPDEFDIDLLLDSQKFADTILVHSNCPGFFHFKVTLNEMTYATDSNAFKTFQGFVDSDYVITTRVLKWIQSVIDKALVNGGNVLETPDGRFRLRRRTGGPAMTINVFCLDSGQEVLRIDLVPCFFFKGQDKWPANGFTKNPLANDEKYKNTDFYQQFFIVPKTPDTPHIVPRIRGQYWRFSFQAQERVLIKDKQTLKLTIKLLKKMRDSYIEHCIPSYYIKTVLLHIAKEKPEDFWRRSLSDVFMDVLKIYANYLEVGGIPYFWNKKCNLIGVTKEETLKITANRLGRMIKAIGQNSDKPETVAKHLLDVATYDSFIAKYKIEAEPIGQILPRESFIRSPPVAPVENEKSSCTIN